MIEDMQVRNFSPHTQNSYVQQVSLFARHFSKSPEGLGPDEIRSYQVYLTNSCQGWATLQLTESPNSRQPLGRPEINRRDGQLWLVRRIRSNPTTQIGSRRYLLLARLGLSFHLRPAVPALGICTFEYNSNGGRPEVVNRAGLNLKAT
jgi:hypothetical protein